MTLIADTHTIHMIGTEEEDERMITIDYYCTGCKYLHEIEEECSTVCIKVFDRSKVKSTAECPYYEREEERTEVKE